MICFAMMCDCGHGFDAWFSSSASYDEQNEAGVIACPACGGGEVRKAPMAPAVLRGQNRRQKATEGQTRDERGQTYAFLSGLREHLKANADDVGKAFPEEARKIHYGEAEERNIYGNATADEAKALIEEGVPALPLPPLPEDQN